VAGCSVDERDAVDEQDAGTMKQSSPAGKPAREKLGITGEIVFHVRHAPEGFVETLGNPGDAIEQRSLLPPLDVIVAFHTHRVALLAEWPKLTAAAEPDGVVWIAWPKRGSDVPTDLSEDVLREELLPTGWLDNKACGIDETWSALRFAQRVERRRPKENARRSRR
jgi:hypothetical protein